MSIATYSKRKTEGLGRTVIGGLSAARALWLVYVGAIAGIVRRGGSGRRRGAVLAQMHSIGNRSMLFIAVTLGFIGLVMIYQACAQFNRITGDLSQVGAQFLRLAVADFAPTLTAMMLATRVGAGIAAEIGSMKVTEQVDALRLSGVLPIDYLITPRLIASVIMTIVLSVFGATIMFAAGGLTAYYWFDVNPRVFFDLSAVSGSVVIIGLIKAACYGTAIPVIAGFTGLRAHGSSEGVGIATTRAVIGSSLAVILLDFVISATALLLGGL